MKALKASWKGRKKLSYIRIEERSYYEIGTKLKIKSCCRSINNRADTQNHSRKLLVGIFYQLTEHFVCKIAAVSKFKSTHATFVACLDNCLCSLKICMIEDRNHSCLLHCSYYLLFVVFCHNINVIRDLSRHPS